MERTKLTALLILFTLLSVASITAIYFTHQLPTEETTIVTLCFYRHTGEYDYTAKLKPNNLYNQTTLGPGEGTLYTNIVDHINLTFSYRFECSLPTNPSMQYSINMELESPEKWVKSFTETEKLEIFQLANTVNPTGETSTTLFINITQIDQLVKLIDTQIGTSTSTYDLHVKPEIHVIANTDVGTINEIFTPNLMTGFKKGKPELNYISIEDLEHTRTGTIDQTQKKTLEGVNIQRYASYAISLPALTGLAYITWTFIKVKPTKPEKPLKEIIAPYEEIIAEAREPSYKGRKATVTMKTLEDLVKVADSLGNPILHSEKESTHTFYVVDGPTKYEYTLTPQIIKKS